MLVMREPGAAGRRLSEYTFAAVNPVNLSVIGLCLALWADACLLLFVFPKA